MKFIKNTTFETKVITMLSILTVLIFTIYIMGYTFFVVYVKPYPKKPSIEVMKIYESESADTWFVLLKFQSEGKKIEAVLEINEGDIMGDIVKREIR